MKLSVLLSGLLCVASIGYCHAHSILDANANNEAVVHQETEQAFVLQSLDWGVPDKDGTQYILLEGNRETAAAFSYAFRIPPGLLDPPHSHSQTARVFVAKGVLSIGYGDVVDKSSMQHYPAGSLVVVPADAVHFDGSDQDTVIYGVANGPWSTTYVDGRIEGSAGTLNQ